MPEKQHIMRSIAPLLLLFLFASCRSYDILIKNAQIYDGLGGEPFAGDLAVKNSKIVKIGTPIHGQAKRTIDASGMALSPGFIDMHAHIEPLSLYPSAQSHIMQGVTTALGGPDGGSPLQLAAYMDTLDVHGIGLNVAYLIGHNTVRNHVMGLVDREPTDEEIRKMKNWIEKAMQEGAFGISTGLKYLPGTFAKTEEVVQLSKVAAKYDGIYTSHLREEGLKLLEGVAEAIEIGRETGMRIVLTHHKAIGQPM